MCSLLIRIFNKIDIRLDTRNLRSRFQLRTQRMETHVPIKIEASKDNTSKMTPQKTMWYFYSKSQPEEEASVLRIQGVKDLLFENVYIIM